MMTHHHSDSDSRPNLDPKYTQMSCIAMQIMTTILPQVDRTSWQLRSAFAWATMSVVKLDYSSMLGRDWCLPALQDVFRDKSYHARASAVGLLDETLHESITREEASVQVRVPSYASSLPLSSCFRLKPI